MYNFSESVGTGNVSVRLSPESISAQLTQNLIFIFSTADSTAVGEPIYNTDGITIQYSRSCIIEIIMYIAPGDYASVTAQYTFVPGGTRLDIPVTIVEDSAFEGAEQFLGRLSTSADVIIDVPQTTVVIDDDDRKYILLTSYWLSLLLQESPMGLQDSLV